MTDPNDIHAAQAAQIDQRLGQAFAFMREIVAIPALLDEIRGGVTLCSPRATREGRPGVPLISERNTAEEGIMPRIAIAIGTRGLGHE